MERREGLSRRRMLQLAGAGMFGAAAFAGCAKEDSPAPSGDDASEKYTITVYDPTGAMEITAEYAARLDTLEGKTIGFVSDEMWQDHRTFPIIKEYLEKTYHCTVLWYDNWPKGSVSLTAAKNGIPEKMKELGVDGAIIGNAG